MTLIRRLIVGGSLCVAVALLTVAPASAQTYTGVTPPNIEAGSRAVATRQVPARSVRVASVPARRGTTVSLSGLPLTGTDVAGLVLLAGVLVVSGLVIVRRTHTRSAS